VIVAVASNGAIGDTIAPLPPVVVVVVVLVVGAGPLSGSSPAASARVETETSRPAIARVLT
jgi:hypothetical protein